MRLRALELEQWIKIRNEDRRKIPSDILNHMGCLSHVHHAPRFWSISSVIFFTFKNREKMKEFCTLWIMKSPMRNKKQKSMWLDSNWIKWVQQYCVKRENARTRVVSCWLDPSTSAFNAAQKWKRNEFAFQPSTLSLEVDFASRATATWVTLLPTKIRQIQIFGDTNTMVSGRTPSFLRTDDHLCHWCITEIYLSINRNCILIKSFFDGDWSILEYEWRRFVRLDSEWFLMQHMNRFISWHSENLIFAAR